MSGAGAWVGTGTATAGGGDVAGEVTPGISLYTGCFLGSAEAGPQVISPRPATKARWLRTECRNRWVMFMVLRRGVLGGSAFES